MENETTTTNSLRRSILKATLGTFAGIVATGVVEGVFESVMKRRHNKTTETTES